MSKEDYLAKYTDYKIPNSLEKLIDFSLQYNGFSQEFYFEVENEKDGYATYSDDEKFLSCLIKIGTADGTGSDYGFWINETKNLANAPIVAFGSEGGCHIIAQNFDELVRLLTFDCEPMIDWDEVFFYKDDEDCESKYHKEFVSFVQNDLNLEIVASNEQANKIVADAQAIYQEKFITWLNQYYQTC